MVYPAQFTIRVCHAQLKYAVVCDLVVAPHAQIHQAVHEVDGDGFEGPIRQIFYVANVKVLDVRAQVNLIQLFVSLGVRLGIRVDLPV